MIGFYNSEVERYEKACEGKRKEERPNVEDFISNDPQSIKWSSSLKSYFERQIKILFDQKASSRSIYRPFCKQWLYFNGRLNHRVSQMPRIFPNEQLENLVLCVTGIGASKNFSILISNAIPDLHFHDTGCVFPLWVYEKEENNETSDEKQKGFFNASKEKAENGYLKRDNIPNSMLKEFQAKYKDSKISKEDIFYYVYGVLHSPEYKQRFESSLKKMLPRIPFAKNFWAFSKAGRELAYWHLNYENIEPYELVETKAELELDPKELYKVEKMTFAKNSKQVDKTQIIYNSKITLSKIPLEAYEYIVNGKSALDWVMERYQITKDKDSGIWNNPNDWSDNPRYIIDLVKRIVRVSLESVKIVKSLPALEEFN